MYLLVAALAFGAAQAPPTSEPREILRKSVALDQSNWLRMKDYTWHGQSVEKHFDSAGKVKSTESEAWETVILNGEPHRRMLEKNGRPLSPAELKKEDEKLDKATAKLDQESPAEKQRRLAEYEKNRRKEREFLREIPDAFNLHLDGEGEIDGHRVWIISGTPKSGYQAHDREAKALAKIHGKIWIDQANYQWVRIEAETADTISFGLFLARLNPGAKLVFEQTPVAEGLWAPKRLYMNGSGRVGIVKKIVMDEEITWGNYRKFQVDSKIVPLEP